MSFKSRWNSKEGDRLARNHRDYAHQALNDWLFNGGDPRHGNECERDWKGEMFERPGAADCPEKQERNRDHAQRMQPAQRSPIGISNFKESNRKQKTQRNDCDRDRNDPFSIFYLLLCRFLGSVFPSLSFSHNRVAGFPRSSRQKPTASRPKVRVLEAEP